MLSLTALCAASALAIAAMMVLVWFASLARRDASLVDRFWGFGFVVVAALGAWLGAGHPPRKVLLLSLVAVWGLRLSIHLTRRNWGHGEDVRYQRMRHAWGDRFWWVSLFTVYILQAAILWVVALPIVFGQSSATPARLTWIDALGALVWLAGFVFETVGDAQLRAFKADPANRGKVMDRGLWRYTRHPNYFGDALLWWGLFLIAAQAHLGLIAVVSPLVMTFLLTRVSGVPMLERQLLRTRPGYEEYCRRTNAFFPWPPKEGRA
jgi:steroid 5-alpha reductase family enzyme